MTGLPLCYFVLEEDRRTYLVRRREEPTVLSETYVPLFYFADDRCPPVHNGKTT